MGKLIMSASNGGGVLSSDTTATAEYVIKGKTYVGADTDEEVGTGTLELTGDVTNEFVLEGKTYYKDNPLDKQTGTMPNLSEKATIKYSTSNNTPVIETDQVFLNENSDGTKRVLVRYSGDQGYLKDNTLFGYPASEFGDATAAHVLNEKRFTSENGLRLSGTMPNIAAVDPMKAISYNNKNFYVGMSYGAHITNASGGNPEVSIPGDTFGDADVQYVVKGKTFTSANGLKKVGTLTCNSILSFSAAADGTYVTFTWKNPKAANGKPYYGVFINYSTTGYPGTSAGEGRLFTGSGTNTESEGVNTVTVRMPRSVTTYYFSCTAYVSLYNDGTWFSDLYGNTLNATVKTGTDCGDCGDCDSCGDSCTDTCNRDSCVDCADCSSDSCGPGDS